MVIRDKKALKLLALAGLSKLRSFRAVSLGFLYEFLNLLNAQAQWYVPEALTAFGSEREVLTALGLIEDDRQYVDLFLMDDLGTAAFAEIEMLAGNTHTT